MPPKQSKKAHEKVVKKVVDDKTFGLKNKNKSKKVQQYVQQVAHQAKSIGRSNKEAKDEEKKKLERQAMKEAKEKLNEEVGELFKAVVDTGKMKQAMASGVDPKSIVCEFFRKGQCKRGTACKFSHDLEASRKTAKIDVYQDPRELAKESMENWDQTKLESVIAQKNGKRGLPPTDIVCKYFVEAIEKKQYGWLWECPNGETCHYRHALPPGFVLKTDKKNAEEEEEEKIPLEEQIEEERRALDLTKCTPLTSELFYKWRADKKKREEEEVERLRQEEAKKADGGGKKAGYRILSGKDLFRYDPSLFIDDEGAEEAYEIETVAESEWETVEEKAEENKNEKAEEGGDGEEKAVTVFSEELFLDDETLPDEGDDQTEEQADGEDGQDEEAEEEEDGEGKDESSSSSS